MPGVPRIGPKRPRTRPYLRAWREHYHLTQRQLAGRLGVTDMTVSRWERWALGELADDEAQPNLSVLAAFAEALDPDLPETALYRLPGQESADELLYGQPPEVVNYAMKMIRAIKQ